jgi:molybdopterin molybdotransferase
MQSVDDYLSEILAAISPLPAVDVALDDALGTVLAADVRAAWPLPGFDNSAMDGYAVFAADVADPPVTLPVDAEVAAGDTRQLVLARGRSVKIMTGALLPEGTDAIVPVEWTDGGTDAVVIKVAAAKGHALRRAGDDAQPGDLLLAAGTRLGPAQVGVLAAAGHGTATVRRRPQVTVISTGDELAPPGSPLVPGLIWDSNSYLLAAAARQAGCEVERHTPQRDDPQEVLAAVDRAVAAADLVVTSGGVSMGGEHDVVKAALTGAGSMTFRKVAMQPGMPQGFGLLGARETPVFTLPGNPVSAFVSFTVFVAPALRVLQGIQNEHWPLRAARLTARAHSPDGKRSFLRGILDAQAAAVTPLTGQASHQIASLARANALIIVPEPVTSLPAGELVQVLELQP